jgi:hypothetical protein
MPGLVKVYKDGNMKQVESVDARELVEFCGYTLEPVEEVKPVVKRAKKPIEEVNKDD